MAVAGISCGDGGAEPQQLPPLTGSPSPSVSPTRTAEDLRQSADQFVRAYYRAFDRANHDSDPSLLGGFYDRRCRPCQYNIGVLARDNRAGHHLEGYEYDLIKLDIGEMQGNTVAATIEIRNKPGRVIRDADGSVVEQLAPTKPVRTDLILARTSGKWRIIDIVPLVEVKQ